MSGYTIIPGRGKVKNNDFLSSMGCICTGSSESKPKTSTYEREKAKIDAMGNKWTSENFRATHDPY